MDWSLETRDLGIIGLTCGLLIVVGFITIMPVVAFDFLGLRAFTYALPKGIIMAICVYKIKKIGVISMIGIIMGLTYLIMPGNIGLFIEASIAGILSDAIIYLMRTDYSNSKVVIAGVALYDFIGTCIMYTIMIALGFSEMFLGTTRPRNLFEMLMKNINIILGNPQMPFVYLLGILVALTSMGLTIIGAWLGIKISTELKQAGAFD
ncbi:MAG: MptD family putative ECF transporter S component [Candidatus Helarchaeota archaeon]